MDAPNTCDVLVVGSGIAGSSAAIEAARQGAHVMVVSLGPTFSGSSFYGGTWGLGLIGPTDDADADDLERTICGVGGDVADRRLVRALVEGVPSAIRWLEDLGVELRRPADATQRAYIPCFDHTTRSWHGLGRASLRECWNREFERLGIAALPRTELLDLVTSDGRVCGAQLFDHSSCTLQNVACGAIVLAGGGLASLYERSLSPRDSAGSVHGIALQHGCKLINAEFLQIMPGLVSPIMGIVANEKAFRYSTLDMPAELLEERSGYGPFTSRLPSHVIDLAINAAGSEGLAIRYQLPEQSPEFVTTYFSGLKESHGIRPTDPMRMALFAHASNGGIAIAEDTSCPGGPSGLFACGECAGGMHGADRIGGLASASALVFGRKAGVAAASVARDARGDVQNKQIELSRKASPLAGRLTARLHHTMSAHALVGRTEEGLTKALCTVESIAQELQDSSVPNTDTQAEAQTIRLAHQLKAAEAMVTAMRERRESKGSHHRADYPPARSWPE